MEFVNTQKALESFKDTIVRRAKLELGTERPRERRSAKWKRSGKGWKPTNVVVKKKRGRYVASGKLQQSIKGSVSVNPTFMVTIKQEDYGAFVEQGRKPKSKFPPSSKIAGWTKIKRLKPRSFKTNKFIKATPSAVKGMNYVIARSIAHFGIKPFPYMDMALDYAIEKHIPEIEKAIAKDLGNGIND